MHSFVQEYTKWLIIEGEGITAAGITGGGIDKMALPLALAFGAYAGLRIYDEVRFLHDYKKRYPHVRIKYPFRTPAYKALGAGVTALAYGAGSFGRPRGRGYNYIY